MRRIRAQRVPRARDTARVHPRRYALRGGSPRQTIAAPPSLTCLRRETRERGASWPCMPDEHPSDVAISLSEVQLDSHPFARAKRCAQALRQPQPQQLAAVAAVATRGAAGAAATAAGGAAGDADARRAAAAVVTWRHRRRIRSRSGSRARQPCRREAVGVAPAQSPPTRARHRRRQPLPLRCQSRRHSPNRSTAVTDCISAPRHHRAARLRRRAGGDDSLGGRGRQCIRRRRIQWPSSWPCVCVVCV